MQTSLFDLFDVHVPQVAPPQRQAPQGARLEPFAGLARHSHLAPALRQAPAILPPAIPIIPSPSVRFKFQVDVNVPGEIGKLKANIEALKVLKALKESGSPATPEQHAALARWCSWGPVARVFNVPTPENLVPYLEELKELLPSSERDDLLSSSKQTVLNAFYTDPKVARAIWQGIESFGFKSGVVFEPSVGAGVFLGMMPEGIWADSEVHGTELDVLTADIARHLYPGALIRRTGFERMKLPVGSVDLFVSNVPFLDVTVVDEDDAELRRLGPNLHDYFFAKAVKTLRPGGLAVFITSTGTLDKKDSTVRNWLAQRAKLLGAIRLPSNTFKNANTAVVTDIVVLQKRDDFKVDVSDETWLESLPWEHDSGNPWVSAYFHEHPECMLGKPSLKKWGGPNEGRGRIDFFVEAEEGVDLAAKIAEIMSTWAPSVDELLKSASTNGSVIKDALSTPYYGDLPDWSFVCQDGGIWVHRTKELREIPIALSVPQRARLEAALALRDELWHLMKSQSSIVGDSSKIDESRKRLNLLYDQFVGRFGFINAKENAIIRKDYGTGPYLLALEIWDATKKEAAKADIFLRRTQTPSPTFDHADNPADAMAISLSSKGQIDLEFMARLCNQSEEAILEALGEKVFQDPLTEKWVSADTYLTGETRTKLRIARRTASLLPRYTRNVEALEKHQPADFGPAQVTLKLGASWIPAKAYQEFLNAIMKGNWIVTYLESTESFEITSDGQDSAWSIKSQIASRSAKWLVSEIFKGGAIKITYQDEEKRTIVAAEETALAAVKAEKLQEEFQSWIWKHHSWGNEVLKLYNNKYNDWVPPKYDGSHLLHTLSIEGKEVKVFAGQSPTISLASHQINGAWRICAERQVLVHYDVGVGKTFTAVSACAESKRMGLINKPMNVAPNHVYSQTASEWIRLYPSAQLCVIDPKDIKKENRPSTLARISTGNWDGIVIAQSTFTKIPMSPDFQATFFEKAVCRIREENETAKSKDLEKAIKSIEARYSKLESRWNKDRGPYFDDLGIDMLVVDEAHEWKNLFLPSRMRESGVNTSHDVQRSWDLFMKISWLKSREQSKVVFLTGTPVSNSMTELFVMMKYLMPDYLDSIQMGQFDSWARTYGVVCSDLESTVDGAGARMKARFRRFVNVGSLQRIWQRISDRVALKDTALKTPDLIGGAPTRVVLDRSDFQSDYVDGLKDRIEAMQSRRVDPKKDNMLKIVTEGRKLALDQRLIHAIIPDDPNSKINNVVENVLRIYQEPTAEKSVQLIWCDLGTPATKKGVQKSELEETDPITEQDSSFDGSPEDQIDMDAEDEFEEGSHGGLNLYEDMRAKLIQKGIPESEVAFIHQAKTPEQRVALFKQVREAEIRVLIASTGKLATGANIQTRLRAAHNIHPPWKPAELEQRAGRMIRQGNLFADLGGVYLYNYVVKGTFDAYMWQILENKQRFLDQFFSGGELNEMENIDFAADQFAEIKAAAAMDPRIGEIVKLQHSIKGLENEKRARDAEEFVLRARKRDFQRNLEMTNERLEKRVQFEERLKGLELSDLEIFGAVHETHKDAGNAILGRINLKSSDYQKIGSVRDFAFSLYVNINEKREEGLQWLLQLDNLRSETFHFYANVPQSIPQGILKCLNGLQGSTDQIRSDIRFWEKRLKDTTEEIEAYEGFTRQVKLDEAKIRLATLEAEMTEEARSSKTGLTEKDLHPIELSRLTNMSIPGLEEDSILRNALNRYQLANGDIENQKNFQATLSHVVSEMLPKARKIMGSGSRKHSKGKILLSLVAHLREEAGRIYGAKLKADVLEMLVYLANAAQMMQIESVSKEFSVIPRDIQIPQVTGMVREAWEALLEEFGEEYSMDVARVVVPLKLLSMDEPVPAILTKENLLGMRSSLLRLKYGKLKLAA